jgi:hypothetical protein
MTISSNWFAGTDIEARIRYMVCAPSRIAAYSAELSARSRPAPMPRPQDASYREKVAG